MRHFWLQTLSSFERWVLAFLAVLAVLTFAWVLTGWLV